MGPSSFNLFYWLKDGPLTFYHLSSIFVGRNMGPSSFMFFMGWKRSPFNFYVFLWLDDGNGEALIVHLGLAVKITRGFASGMHYPSAGPLKLMCPSFFNLFHWLKDGPFTFQVFSGVGPFHLSSIFLGRNMGPSSFMFFMGWKRSPFNFYVFLWLDDGNGEALIVHLGLAVKITRGFASGMHYPSAGP